MLHIPGKRLQIIGNMSQRGNKFSEKIIFIFFYLESHHYSIPYKSSFPFPYGSGKEGQKKIGNIYSKRQLGYSQPNFAPTAMFYWAWVDISLHVAITLLVFIYHIHPFLPLMINAAVLFKFT